jgi:hypothetical protein
LKFQPVKIKNSRFLNPFVLFLTLFFASNSLARYKKGTWLLTNIPWTSNGCGAIAEFVELLNFGPGPVDIGCYIVTD